MSAGERSRLLPWVGGLSGNQSANNGGYRSRFLWWAGGLSAPATTPPPPPSPTTGTGGGPTEPLAWYHRYRQWLEEQQLEDRADAIQADVDRAVLKYFSKPKKSAKRQETYRDNLILDTVSALVKALQVDATTLNREILRMEIERQFRDMESDDELALLLLIH